MTKEFLSRGKYEIEVMGQRYPATPHLRSPFDPTGMRMKGDYENRFKEESHFED